VLETLRITLLETLRIEGRNARDKTTRQQQDQVERISRVLVASSADRSD